MYRDPICNFKHKKLQIYICIPKYEIDQILQANHKIKNQSYPCGFHRTQCIISQDTRYHFTGHTVSFRHILYVQAKGIRHSTPQLSSFLS